MPMSEKALQSAIVSMEHDFLPYNSRMMTRRALIERMPDVLDVGTNVPSPFDESKLIIKTVVGEVVDGVQHYAARIAANPPQPVVPRFTDKGDVTRRTDTRAAEQERLLTSIWDSLDGSQKQFEVAWSQAWCRVGWYLTLPRDVGWGLPDREYFEDLTDEELAELRNSGRISPSSDERMMESGESWIQRRRKYARDNALAGKTLFTLETYPGDMVRFRRDRDGIKYAYIAEEMPASDFLAGGDIATAAAKQRGVDPDNFSIWMDSNGKIIAGIPQGGEEGAFQSTSMVLIRFFDREYVYYMVGGPGKPDSAVMVWKAEHGAGEVPLVPVPGVRTDSRKPGNEYSSPMEPVFAYAPLLNQVETLLSNVAAFNAIPRWVIEKPDGSLVVDPTSGEPKILGQEDVPGLDPSQAQVVEGKIVQLTINADMLLKMLEVYASQLQAAMPPDVATGDAGTSGPAWTVRQLLTSAQEDLHQPVSNHALAMERIFRIWTRWMRLLDVPIYAVSAPGHRKSENVRGLIEFDPEDLVEAVEVKQSKDNASDRIVLQQHGIELFQGAKVIDARKFFEEYALEEDPVEAEMDMWAQRAVDIVMGIGPPAPPNSVLAQIVQGVQGRTFLAMMERSPNAALLQAELMAAGEQLSNPATQGMTVSDTPTNMQPEGGNVAEANGLRQPGVGMGPSMPGSPEMAEANIGQRP